MASRKGAVQLTTIANLRRFMPGHQVSLIQQLMRGEEGQWFRDKVTELVALFGSMPKTYEQEKLGDQAIVYLHYFSPSGDWWITERDKEAIQHQAFGLADMGEAELGYISLVELCQSNAVELDLHWTPITLAEVKKRREPADDAVKVPEGWGVVSA